MKYTHIIWDFNGTLLDDVDIGIQAINVLLTARGLHALSREKYKEVSGFPIVDYYKRIGFDFSREPYDEVAHEWVAQYMDRVQDASICKGALDMLAYARQAGLSQILLSATELDMLRGQVASLEIGRFFDEICGMDNVYAHGKRSLAERWRAAHPDAKAVLVGDTDHDYEVAMAMGADCVLFSGGHQSRRRLVRLGCPIVDKLSDLKPYLL